MNRFIQRASIAAFLLCTIVQPARGQDPKPHLDARPDLTAMSLVEQAKKAEEQDRDFAKAIELYDRALEKAISSKNEDVIAQVKTFRAQAQARQAGIAPAVKPSDSDPMICRLAERLHNLEVFGPETEEIVEAYEDISLLGAIAVPWLEKAIGAPYDLCNLNVGGGNPPLYVRALAQMSAPEGVAALEKLLSSPDPIVRRAVAHYASPDRHRAVLLKALKDPAEAVRDQAIERLSKGTDPKLFEVLSPFARSGNLAALGWMIEHRPDELLRIAASPNLLAAVRSNALESLKRSKNFRPDAAAIDALIAVAGSQTEYTVRNAAMDLLQKGVCDTWKPLDPLLAKRIEDAIRAAPDSFPTRAAMSTLEAVGSASSLALLIERTTAEDMSPLVAPIGRILGRSGPADFAAVVAAFAKAPVPVRGVQTNNGMGEWVHNSLRSCLEALARGELTSVEIAKGAKVLPPAARRIYLQSVVVGWLEANTNTDAAIARLPKFESGFLDLLREMAASGEANFTTYAIRGLGASGDAKVLPELTATMATSDLDGNTITAIRRLTAKDPQRIRTVLELLLGIKAYAPQNFCPAFQSIVDKPKSDELLEVVNALWTPQASERLMALVTGAVPGPAGCEVLMKHYAELDASAFDTRMRVIQRFGQDLFEPALDLIGGALRDPNERVRQTAGTVFERFKSEQQRVKDFNEWRNSDAQKQKTIGELIPLLDNANPDVVIGAVKALRALKARSCYPKLVLLLEKHKDNANVKDVVMQTLDELGK